MRFYTNTVGTNASDINVSNTNTFYKDINFLTIQDNVELIQNVQIQHCPSFLQKNIRYIQLEELYLDEIYFDPPQIYFFQHKINNTEYIHISPFTLIINGEIFYINQYENVLSKKDMLYLTKQGIMKNVTNKTIEKQNNSLTDLLFANDRIYWFLSYDNINQYSVLIC